MKYLISLYFDESTNKQICEYMKTVAEATGNDYMHVNKVPPHITVSSFDVEETGEYDIPENFKIKLDDILRNIPGGEIQWVGCGAFKSSVLYLAPVLNLYLQEIIERVYACVSEYPDIDTIKISKFYKPYEWLPHTTIGKKMNADELTKGFAVVQSNFHILRGKVVRVGLAKASPYEEIINWEL